MTKVLWGTAMSLDGFIAGPDDAMDWVFRYDGPHNDMVDEMIGATGAILAGRNSYDVGRKPGQHEAATEPFGGAWQGPEFVLTHNPPDDDPKMTFLSGDITVAVRTVAEAAGGKDVLVLGADVARQCVDAGLVDEIWITLLPVLLGDGVRLFGEPYGDVALETIHVAQVGQTTNLKFRVRK